MTTDEKLIQRPIELAETKLEKARFFLAAVWSQIGTAPEPAPPFAGTVLRGSSMYYRMDRVHQLLADLCEDIERQIRPNLRGLMGNLVHGYLPQVWVFETECGACTLFLDTEGNARVFPGADRDVDVTIHWRKDALESILASRNRDSVSPGDYPDVTVHTDKGRAAFNYLKKEIGL